MATTKIALVTGANRGIGFETARQLAKQNIHVLIGARTEAKGKQAEADLKNEGLSVAAVVLDIDNTKTHHAAAEFIRQSYGKLDILVNNAGIMLDENVNGHFAPASQTSADILRRTFDTNFFNVVGLTQTMLPLLKQSDSGRIVFVSSLLGSVSLHANPNSPIYDLKITAYDCSKSALNAYTTHLAYELKDTPVKVNAAHPGSVKTDMNANGEIDVHEGAKTSVALATLAQDGYSGKFVYLGEMLPW